jgi:hypothetical protein
MEDEERYERILAIVWLHGLWNEQVLEPTLWVPEVLHFFLNSDILNSEKDMEVQRANRKVRHSRN